VGLFGKKKAKKDEQPTTEPIVETTPVETSEPQIPVLNETAATIDKPAPSAEAQALTVDVSGLFDGATTKEDEITNMVSEEVDKEDVALGVAPHIVRGEVDDGAAVFTTEIPESNETTPVEKITDIQNIEENTTPVEIPEPITEEAVVAPTIPNVEQATPIEASSPIEIATPTEEAVEPIEESSVTPFAGDETSETQTDDFVPEVAPAQEAAAIPTENGPVEDINAQEAIIPQEIIDSQSEIVLSSEVEEETTPEEVQIDLSAPETIMVGELKENDRNSLPTEEVVEEPVDAPVAAEEPVTEEVVGEVVEETPVEEVVETTPTEPVTEEVTEEVAEETQPEEQVIYEEVIDEQELPDDGNVIYEEVIDEPNEEVVEETTEEPVVEEPPIEETVEETPIEETVEEPVTEEVVEEQPVEEVVEETPVEETVEEPITEETVLEEVPTEETVEEVVEEQPQEELSLEEPLVENDFEEQFEFSLHIGESHKLYL